MNDEQKVQRIEDNATVIVYSIMKRIIQPYTEFEAYKLGLIDEQGNITKEPVSLKERLAFTLVDKLAIKLKQLLGSRMMDLNTFVYLNTISDYDELAYFILNRGLAGNGYFKKTAQTLNKSMKVKKQIVKKLEAEEEQEKSNKLKPDKINKLEPEKVKTDKQSTRKN
jgi:hypothetical protein